MTILLVVVLAYLCGSIPIGVILAKNMGIDVRKVGSGNIGATNVARSVGKKAGILTLLGDAAKGLITVLIVRTLNWGTQPSRAQQWRRSSPSLFAVSWFFRWERSRTGLGVFSG
jgi:acyl-phosphate glycerol 3-phosphate acyltransferase